MSNQILERFKLADWVSDDSVLLKKMADVFDNDVVADFYDVRREQIELLNSLGILNDSQKQQLFSTYYLDGNKELIAPYYDALDSSGKREFEEIVPFRKRAYSEIIVDLSSENNFVEVLPEKEFTQDADDYRKLPRKFSSISKNLLKDHDFHSLLKKIAEYIRLKAGHGSRFRFEFHVMRLLVSGKAKTNTPEGKHQDGADYIIMFIAKKTNLRGGVSRVFEKRSDGSFKLVQEFLLGPSEGLFMSDASSNLYHEVSPMEMIDDNKDGIRDLFGFDISII